MGKVWIGLGAPGWGGADGGGNWEEGREHIGGESRRLGGCGWVGMRLSKEGEGRRRRDGVN